MGKVKFLDCFSLANWEGTGGQHAPLAECLSESERKRGITIIISLAGS
jgi:hypothetical protein